MTEKKYPYILLTGHSLKGNNFEAYESKEENAKIGYHIFISSKKELVDTCECMGYIHGKECYHIIDAKKLQQKLFGKFDIGAALESANQKRERGE